MFQNLKIVDTYFVRGIQNLRQLTILNPIYIDIDKSPNFTELGTNYPSTRYVYRLKLNSVTLSPNITKIDKEILITCTGFSSCKMTKKLESKTWYNTSKKVRELGTFVQ